MRTRGEEILQGAMSTLVPIFLALIFVWTIPPFNRHPFNFPDTAEVRGADYKLVAGVLYSEDLFKQDREAFWRALARTGRRQGRFLVWYYWLIFLEGWLCGILSVSYPRLIGQRWYRWTAEHVLLPNISEWHVLLTPFFFQDKTTLVLADVLCADNTLYRGQVWSHSLSKEGQLSGMIITEAKRYARDDYLKAKEKGEVNKADYWHSIPGTKLYVFGDKILNINLSYEGPAPPPAVMEHVISRQLKQPIKLVITFGAPIPKTSPPEASKS